MSGETPGDRRMADASADVLQRELEQARVALQRAERRARTYLAEHAVLDQTHVDLAAALARPGGDKTDRD